MSSTPSHLSSTDSTGRDDLESKLAAYNAALEPFLDRFTTTICRTGDQVTGFKMQSFTPIGSAHDGNGISVDQMDLMALVALMSKAHVLHTRAEPNTDDPAKWQLSEKSSLRGRSEDEYVKDVNSFMRDALALYTGVDMMPVSEEEAKRLDFHVPFATLTVSDQGPKLLRQTCLTQEARGLRRWKRSVGSLRDVQSVQGIWDGLMGSIDDSGSDSDGGPRDPLGATASTAASDDGAQNMHRGPASILARQRSDVNSDSDSDSDLASILALDNEGITPGIDNALSRLNQLALSANSEQTGESDIISPEKKDVIQARRAGRMVPAAYEL